MVLSNRNRIRRIMVLQQSFGSSDFKLAHTIYRWRPYQFKGQQKLSVRRYRYIREYLMTSIISQSNAWPVREPCTVVLASMSDGSDIRLACRTPYTVEVTYFDDGTVSFDQIKPNGELSGKQSSVDQIKSIQLTTKSEYLGQGAPHQRVKTRILGCAKDWSDNLDISYDAIELDYNADSYRVSIAAIALGIVAVLLFFLLYYVTFQSIAATFYLENPPHFAGHYNDAFSLNWWKTQLLSSAEANIVISGIFLNCFWIIGGLYAFALKACAQRLLKQVGYF